LNLYTLIVEKLGSIDAHLKDFGISIKWGVVSFGGVEQTCDKLDKKIAEIIGLMPILNSYAAWDKFYS
jgi:hypothetical protein